MKKISIIAFVFILLPNLLWGKEITLSVSDFLVESDNPAYRYIGKGISRLVAGELRKSTIIKLIEREQLKQILKEQEFSLSDLADQQNQIEIGRLLVAEYIVLGEIIDMVDTLLISVRLVNVTSSEIIWAEEITEKLEAYDYIGAYFAKSILTQFGAEVEKTIVQKMEKKEEKKEEAIIKLSEGIDAFDRDDVQNAKKVLEEVKELDPVSEVADYYLAKLVINTTKFKVITEPYFSYQNPAYLGIMKTDRFHLAAGSNWPFSIVFGEKGSPVPGPGFVPIPGYENKILREQDTRFLSLGYYFPFGKSMGMGIEAFWSLVSNEVADKISENDAISHRLPLGGIFNLGFKVTNSISLGLGLSLYSQRNIDWGSGVRKDISPIALGGIIGFLSKNSNENFIYDTQLAYSTGSTDIVDPATVTIERVVHSPLFWENTFTFSFNQRKTFFVIKQLNDISVDRIFYYGRLLPAVEHYFLNWLSLRIGVEGSYILLNDSHNFGFGVLVGVTFRVIKWGLDIDINTTYRRKPSRVVEGMMMDDIFLGFHFNLNDVYISRD